MKALDTTIGFLRVVLKAADIQGARGQLDIFADRLLRATSEPTLSVAIESLLRAVNASSDKMHPPAVAAMVQIAGSVDGPRVLRWLRDQTKLATMLAATYDEEVVKEALAEIKLPDTSAVGAAVRRQPYAISLKAVCETPLTHGADTKAGNAMLFRRITVLATNGSVMSLPYYSGNAVRGQVRDLLADHLVTSLGLPADRSKPALALWLFYMLYSGGILEAASKVSKELKNQMGKSGAIRAEGIRLFRDKLPTLSLLGCALGDRVLPGHVQVADLRPVCAEWGTGTTPVAELLTWEFLTRREDYEGHEEHHGMIATTEVLRAGAELEGGIDMDAAIPKIERSALGLGLKLLAERGMLGGQNRRGLGRVKLAVEHAPDATMYETWLSEHKDETLEYLREIGGLAT